MTKELKDLEKEMEEKYPLYIKDYNGEIRKVSKERAKVLYKELYKSIK